MLGCWSEYCEDTVSYEVATELMVSCLSSNITPGFEDGFGIYRLNANNASNINGAMEIGVIAGACKLTITYVCQDSSEGTEGGRSQDEEVAKWWGEWSSWSTCSRTCGGGVMSKERHCLQQRLIASQNISVSICTGPSKHYQLCNKQPCPENGISFKQQQCAAFNAKAFGRRRFHWIPLSPDDYINISNKPCDLQCTTRNGERQLMVPAQDGTSCSDRVHQGVCIEGQCESVGCDGTLFSSKTLDKCGICGGDGSTCYRVSGTFRKAITQLGYTFITNIPIGATDIQIIERRKTENILALSDDAGNFFFNGDPAVNNPQNFRVAGTVFKYRRPSNLYSDGLEYIVAQGPINQGVNVMYYNLNGKMPHITYEFTIPRRLELQTTIPSSGSSFYLTGRDAQTGDDVNYVDQGSILEDYNTTLEETSYYDNEIANSESQKYSNFTGRISGKAGNRSVTEMGDLVWHDEVYKEDAEFHSNKAIKTFEEKVGHTAQGIDLNVIRTSVTQQNNTQRLQEELLRNRLINSKVSGYVRACINNTCENIPTAVFGQKQGNEPPQLSSGLKGRLLEYYTREDVSRTFGSQQYPGSEEDPGTSYSLMTSQDYPLASGNISQQLKFVRVHGMEPVQTPDTESNEFEVGVPGHSISTANTYRWKVSAFGPCSSTCTTGLSSSYAICVQHDGVEVEESHCDALSRPEPVHEVCSGRECQPRWETSRWSECSRTCGGGFQFRTVRCWKMIAPGFDSSVYDDLCYAAEVQKPVDRKECKNKPCGPQWEISQWSECSARCGSKGVMTREVRCSVEAHQCDEATKPISSEECTGPPCDWKWTVSDWLPCSGSCGEGRMTRYVVCRNSVNQVISNSHCDPASKPLAVYPCGDKNCPAHWVEQEWEQCNATCGRGVKSRQVLCAGLENGIYKEYLKTQCDLSQKPEEQADCFERPCSKWFTTSWSQCSKTCGNGVKVREVKCYQGDELGSGCDAVSKPEVKQTCEIQPCPIEAPVSDDNCEDKASANCAMILKMKFCTNWYYKKACCMSCKDRSSQ
ncbi:ADAMTS-like protein 2 [Protopterus annectens]|uniref:ADAMTS-like protein 2 n=1 Tax=Protopterus annectens TaxID=7888 RepID=UPI001CF97E97|nr:ADAMTS-like protein 2 [Protopterus annectens]